MMATTRDSTPRSFRQALKCAVAEKRLLVIPGAYDALSALLIERAGFDCMFVGGFPVTAQQEGRWRRVGDTREPDRWMGWGESDRRNGSARNVRGSAA